MTHDVADGTLTTRRDPFPVLGQDSVEIAEDGVPIRSRESVIQQVEILFDRLCRHLVRSSLRLSLFSFGSRYLRLPQTVLSVGNSDAHEATARHVIGALVAEVGAV